VRCDCRCESETMSDMALVALSFVPPEFSNALGGAE
jgi:hypothetical protein